MKKSRIKNLLDTNKKSDWNVSIRLPSEKHSRHQDFDRFGDAWKFATLLAERDYPGVSVKIASSTEKPIYYVYRHRMKKNPRRVVKAKRGERIVRRTAVKRMARRVRMSGKRITNQQRRRIKRYMVRPTNAKKLRTLKAAEAKHYKKNPAPTKRLIEIVQQAGMFGWHVFVDGLYDADIRPSKTADEALRKAYKEYPRTGGHKNLDYSYYSEDYNKNPRRAQPKFVVDQYNKNPRRNTDITLQEKRGASWVTLSSFPAAQKALALAVAKALHKRKPRNTYRLFSAK